MSSRAIDLDFISNGAGYILALGGMIIPIELARAIHTTDPDRVFDNYLRDKFGPNLGQCFIRDFNCMVSLLCLATQARHNIVAKCGWFVVPYKYVISFKKVDSDNIWIVITL